MAYNKRKREEAFSKYEVFINHRGPDTKNTLASLLYEHLHRLGFRVFLDREELNTGDCVSPEIKAAIDTSSVNIAIFSPTYAESQWCLQELCWMLQQGSDSSTIIPIFWDVEPSDLRRVEKGQYAEAFKKHKARGSMDIQKWEEALKNAAEIKGHVFHTGEGDLGKFFYEIVDIVQKKVRREPLVVDEHPVGLDKVAKNLSSEILKQMDSNADVTIVGIAGLGGSGKTTLAAYLYNLKHSLFRSSSFLCDVSQRSELTSLQEELLYDLGGCTQLHIGNTKQGKSLLRQHLRGLSRVLIVLDGIDRHDQIDGLLFAVKDVLVDGSLIVITSRDKDLLACCEVHFVHDMQLLDEKEAAQLFCHHAFRELEAPTGFEDLVKKMVEMCEGYPLALKYWGVRLFRKRKSYWELQLKNLQKNPSPNEIVQNIFKPSYDSLDEEAKVVLLDVASFFEGLDIPLRVRVYGKVECPLLFWIETLAQKCLVEFHCIEMHVHDGENGFFKDLFTYTECSIGMHRFVKNMAKKLASEDPSVCLSYSESQMISSDYEISDWEWIKEIQPDLNTLNVGIQEFQQLMCRKAKMLQLKNSAMEPGNHTNWSLSIVSRQMMIHKIMETLRKHMPATSADGLTELKKIALRFEEKIFSAAADQQDYLQKISLKMLSLAPRSQVPGGNASGSASSQIF